MDSWLDVYSRTPIPQSDPCLSCKRAADCDTVCPLRARWWDHIVRGEPIPRRLGRAGKLWSVWNRFTNEQVVADATAQEAVEAMGISLKYFREISSGYRHGKEHPKWYIEGRFPGPEERHSMGGPRYTVYNNKTDELVALDATATEAMEAMGITSLNSFQSTVGRVLTGKTRKWYIEVTEE